MGSAALLRPGWDVLAKVMSGYLLHRLAISVIVAIGISIVTFALLHMVYPQPGRDVLGVRASVAAVKAWNRQHGFAGPVAWQYWRYVSLLLHGNLGYSVTQNQPVSALFGHRWARSAYLSGASLLLALLISVPLGIFQAVRRNGLTDHVATGVELALYASVADQYRRFVTGVLHGNFGHSPRLNVPIAAVFARWWARSLYLTAVSMALAILITVPLGIFQAVRRNGLEDHLATGIRTGHLPHARFPCVVAFRTRSALGSDSDRLLAFGVTWDGPNLGPCVAQAGRVC